MPMLGMYGLVGTFRHAEIAGDGRSTRFVYGAPQVEPSLSEIRLAINIEKMKGEKTEIKEEMNGMEE